MSKIAVIDSGLGGLTVLSRLKALLPEENYIYFGDSANAPYGEKTREQLGDLCSHACSMLLEREEIKCFVVACNTTTSQALDILIDRFPEHPFIGIEPAVTWAAEENPGKNILVLATTATINGKKLNDRIAALKGKAQISALAAPGIVPYVESRRQDRTAFMAYLKELLKDYSKDTDCVVLGCTHFPFIKDELRECFEKEIRFYDAAELVAVQVKELLSEKKLLNRQENDGTTVFLNSDESKVELEEMLLNEYK